MFIPSLIYSTIIIPDRLTQKLHSLPPVRHQDEQWFLVPFRVEHLCRQQLRCKATSRAGVIVTIPYSFRILKLGFYLIYTHVFFCSHCGAGCIRIWSDYDFIFCIISSSWRRRFIRSNCCILFVSNSMQNAKNIEKEKWRKKNHKQHFVCLCRTRVSRSCIDLRLSNFEQAKVNGADKLFFYVTGRFVHWFHLLKKNSFTKYISRYRFCWVNKVWIYLTRFWL